MNKLLVVVATLAIVAAQSAVAQVACNVGVYSKYIGAIGGVPDNRPVVQGDCTKMFGSMYANAWFSESLSNPGLAKTSGNEIDFTLGWAGKISEKWSADIHTAYYDMTNPRLLRGTNGDLADIGGTLKYHVSDATSVYANVEYYYGLGQNGFPNGGIAGVGVRTNFADQVNVDGVIYHNNHFFGRGEFLKLSVEPAAPVWQFAGSQVRPNVTFWKPIGSYGKTHDRHIVVGVRVNW